MKLRYGFLVLAATCCALLVAGCGDDSGDKDKKMSKAQAAVKKDRATKEKAVDKAKKDFKKKDDDVAACRTLAMSYIGLASPAPSPDPKKPSPLPKDRDKSLNKAVDTLEDCRKIDKKDRDIQQMLASSYMATNKYAKAAKLLEDLAKSSKGTEQANAYYAWGLAASNAQKPEDAITAWRRFIELAPKADPRVAQVRQSIKALQTMVKG